MLTEAHIPFAVTTDMDWLGDGRRDAYELVIAPDGAPPELDAWVEQGGRLLVAGTSAPAFTSSRVVAVHGATRGAWRVHDHALFPSLGSTNLIILDSDYAELPPDAGAPLTLIPPAMTGPPELVWLDKVETQVPGLLIAEHGRGRFAWIPWRPGESYYRYSSPGHAGLVVDLVDHLVTGGRQLRTDAHPLIEITLMRQPARNRTLVHFVNVSGHSSTGYFPPLAAGAIDVEVTGSFSGARAVKHGSALAVERTGHSVKFTVPAVTDYEVVVLE